MRIKSCLILGGGLAGLTLADCLSSQGIRVVVAEKEAFLGGLCRRVSVDGSGVDLGPHVLKSQRDDVLNYWRELIGDDLTRITNTAAQMLFQGKLLSYPVKPGQVLKQLAPITVLRCGLDLLFEKAKTKVRADQATTFEDWAVKNYGRSLYDAFFAPLTEKVWGIPPSLIDVEYARKRIPPLSLRQLLFKAKPKGGYHSEDPRFSAQFYPRYGVYQFCEAILKRLEKKDAQILTDTRVQDLRLDADGARVRINGEEQVFDYVASTVPLPALSELLGWQDTFSMEYCAYRGVGFMFLSVPEAVKLPVCVIYCADRNVPFNRVSDYSFFSKDLLPPGRNVICVEYHRRDLPEAQQNAEMIESLRVHGLFDTSVIHSIENDHTKFVYPIYRLGYRRELISFLERAATLDRLVLLGRQGLFVHSNTDQVTEQAFATSEMLRSSPFDGEKKAQFYGIGQI